jgi:hypothetical protein
MSKQGFGWINLVISTKNKKNPRWKSFGEITQFKDIMIQNATFD